MIRINLLPSPHKKKPKPLPAFIISITFITLLSGAVLLYLSFNYASNLKTAKVTFAANETKKIELKKKVMEVEDFEKRNKTFEERNAVIEKLRKKQNLPVAILDEISRNLPNGVWLISMTVAGEKININGFAFTNSDVVLYVDNMKNSKAFTDIFLEESRQTDLEKIPLYQFKMTFRTAV